MLVFRIEEVRKGMMMEPQSTENFALIAQSRENKIDQWKNSQPEGAP